MRIQDYSRCKDNTSIFASFRWQRGISLAPITPNYELCIMNYELKITPLLQRNLLRRRQGRGNAGWPPRGRTGTAWLCRRERCRGGRRRDRRSRPGEPAPGRRPRAVPPAGGHGGVRRIALCVPVRPSAHRGSTGQPPPASSSCARACRHRWRRCMSVCAPHRGRG